MITIPLNIFKAVAQAQSKDQTRYYLCGVYCTDTTLVATNAHILLKYELYRPTGITEPLIIKVDLSEKAMNPPSNIATDRVYMHLDLEKCIIETYRHDGKNGPVGERLGVCGFDIIDGTFPDYERVIPPEDALDSDNRFFDFNPYYIKPFRRASRLLCHFDSLRITINELGGACRVNFYRCPEMIGVIMPTVHLKDLNPTKEQS